MKKQWLSIVLVLCMVLCLAPATARAEEGETGTLRITVKVLGLDEGDDAGGKTFSFKILRKYAIYRAKQRAQWMCQSRQENIS